MLNASNLIAYAQKHSCIDRARLTNLYELAEDVQNRDVDGDFVECGCLHGGSAAILAGTILDSDRKLWLYDTFDKMPAPKGIDGPAAQVHAGTPVGTVEGVSRVVAGIHSEGVRFTRERVIFRKGLFDDTFSQQPLPEKIALLHIDCDWYESVNDCLDALYGRVSDRGFVILDDFGYFEGCRLAFYSFCERNGLAPLLERCGYTEAWWQKGATNNRHLEGLE